MEWNGIEWGGTDNLPHVFLLISRAFESFFWGAVEFNSGVEVRSYALPVFQMKLQTVYALYFGRTLNRDDNVHSITFRSIPFQVIKNANFGIPSVCIYLLTCPRCIQA